MQTLLTVRVDYLMMRGKDALRGFPPLAIINRILKAYLLRSGLRALRMRYAKRAALSGYLYSEPGAVAEFRRRLSACPHKFPKNVGELRVFWVGANRDQDESGFLQALRRLASVVEFRNHHGEYGQWYWDEYKRVRVYDPAIVAMNDRCLVSQVAAALQTGPVHFLLGQMWRNYISTEALAAVRAYGIPVVNISMDDRLPDNWRSQRGTRLGAIGLASVSDFVLTTSAETCAWYGMESCPAMFWPLASDPDLFSLGSRSQRDINVLFVGNKYGVRERIINALMSNGIHVECYGAGWPNGPATAEQSVALFKRARIVLGVGTVGYCDDVFTLKLRDFDAPMSGALYITHRNPDLALLYEEGKDIECYTTTEECVSKIRYYLQHPDQLKRIAASGHSRALRASTWLTRLQQTFTRLGLLVPVSTQLAEHPH